MKETKNPGNGFEKYFNENFKIIKSARRSHQG